MAAELASHLSDQKLSTNPEALLNQTQKFCSIALQGLRARGSFGKCAHGSFGGIAAEKSPGIALQLTCHLCDDRLGATVPSREEGEWCVRSIDIA